jgi:hypothetical protein
MKLIPISFAFIFLIISSCQQYVTSFDVLPDFKASNDKALCIVLSVEGNFDELVPLYIDGVLSGATFDTSLTAIEVSPGERFLTAALDNQATIRLNFIAGKSYFVKLGTLEVPMFDGVKMTLISDKEANNIINSIGKSIKSVKLNSDVTLNDFDSEDYKEEVDEYWEWAKENPKDAKIQSDYLGY